MTIRWAYDPSKCAGYELCRDCDTCPIKDETKPTVFNYKDFVDLKKKCAHQADEIMRLKAENTDLKILLFRAYLIIKAEVKSDAVTYNQ